MNLDSMPLKAGHFKILAIASSGQFLGSAIATLVGIILPLLQLSDYPEITSLEQGLICCVELIGIMAGSTLIGRLCDKFGYLLFFRISPLIVMIAALLVSSSTSITELTICLFIMGFSIGGEYAMDPSYISEFMPQRWKLLMVGIAKACAPIGGFFAAIASFILLNNWYEASNWNLLLMIIAIISLIMFVSRLRFVESPGWLICNGKTEEARKVVKRILGKEVELGMLANKSQKTNKISKFNKSDLLQGENLKKAIFGGVPWACEGVGVYGIGIFIPILLLALGLESASGSSFHKVTHSVEITSYINLFMLAGFAVGLFFTNKIVHRKIQIAGFILCTLGLLLMLVSYLFHWPVYWTLAFFILFEIFLNGGPHLMTFILPSQIYEVSIRAEGVGLCATIGKAGAIIGTLFIPLLLKWGGMTLVLIVVAFVEAIGAFITYFVGKELNFKESDRYEHL